MAPEPLARVVVIIYGVFLGLVLAERAANLDDARAQLKAALDRHRRSARLEHEYLRSRLRMAFEVWELTGQRVDRA